MSLKDIVKKELIGLEVELIEAKNKANVGIKGKIINETKNMLTIETDKGRKMVIKENVKLLFPKLGVKIDGRILAKRPEERIKAKW